LLLVLHDRPGMSLLGLRASDVSQPLEVEVEQWYSIARSTSRAVNGMPIVDSPANAARPLK
jgi:hypothetical protein